MLKKIFIFLKDMVIYAIALVIAINLLVNDGVIGGIQVGYWISFIGVLMLIYALISDSLNQKKIANKSITKKDIFQYILFAVLLIYYLIIKRIL